jgi:hypothetical protein
MLFGYAVLKRDMLCFNNANTMRGNFSWGG